MLYQDPQREPQKLSQSSLQSPDASRFGAFSRRAVAGLLGQGFGLVRVFFRIGL